MKDKARKIIAFLGSIWIFLSGIMTFGIACALSAKGIIDIFAFVSLITISVYALEKNRK